MWLDKAEEFFAIKFSGRGLSRFARRLFWST